MSCCASCGAKTKGALIMAIFHMTAKVCKTSATAKIDYIQRQNKYSYSTKAEDLIFSSEKNIPAWAKNARDFFAEMDTRIIQKRKRAF